MKAVRLLAWITLMGCCVGGEARAAGNRVVVLGANRGYDHLPYFELVLTGSSMTTARAALEADGFVFSSADSFRTADLAGFDIAFLGLFDPSESLTTADRIGLLTFVMGGGAVIYMGDNDFFRTPNSAMGGLFGVTFKQDPSATSASTVFDQRHPIIRGPAGVVEMYDCSLNLPGYFGGMDGFGTAVSPILGTENRTVVAAIGHHVLQAGSGPIVFVSEASGFMNAGLGTIDKADNLPLLRNIFAYAGGMSVGFCVTAQDCEDGLFCNGGESCGAGQCLPGVRPCSIEDGCYEDTDTCGPCTANDQCGDGVFCNGIERCSNGVCVRGPRPCAAHVGCHEINDTCGPCENDLQCEDLVYCNGSEICLSDGRCGGGESPCDGECDRCHEESKTCTGCLLDLDDNDVIGTGDFAQFAGCFGACYPANDPCLVANFDGSDDGCVGTGDFAAFAGCFGGSCIDCDNCERPAQSAEWNATAGSETAVQIELVAVRTPTASDVQSALPDTRRIFRIGESIHVEVWASRVTPGVHGIASVYVDMSYDEHVVGFERIAASHAFGLFADGESVSADTIASLGGCAQLGEKSMGSDSTWVRIASARVHGTRQGTATFSTESAGPLHGISIVGEFGNLFTTAVSFGSLSLRFYDETIGIAEVELEQTAIPLAQPKR